MNTRPLGNNGPMLTEIGLGTWAIGGPSVWGWGPQDDKESINTIHKALDLGINWLDTAPFYGLGHSEEIIAKAINGKRDEIFIATKCGLVWNRKGKISYNNTPQSILNQIEKSLIRLQTDYIDLFQIHWPDPNTPVEKSWEVMVKLKEQGKVNFIGVSNFSLPLLKKCEAIHHINSLQPPYSLLNHNVEKKIMPWCMENGVGIIAYSPLQSGLLTAKFNKLKLARDDWRHKNPYFQEPQLTKNLKFATALKPIAKEYGKTVTQLAICWILMNPAVTSAIVGARRPAQVQEIIGGVDWYITREDLTCIEKLNQEFFS